MALRDIARLLDGSLSPLGAIVAHRGDTFVPMAAGRRAWRRLELGDRDDVAVHVQVLATPANDGRPNRTARCRQMATRTYSARSGRSGLS